MFLFYTLCKHEKTLGFSDVFRRVSTQRVHWEQMDCYSNIGAVDIHANTGYIEGIFDKQQC